MLAAFVSGTYLMIQHLHPCRAWDQEGIIWLLSYCDLLTFSHIYAFLFLLLLLCWILRFRWESDFQLFHGKESQHFTLGLFAGEGCYYPKFRQVSAADLGIHISECRKQGLALQVYHTATVNSKCTLNVIRHLLSISHRTGCLRS